MSIGIVGIIFPFFLRYHEKIEFYLNLNAEFFLWTMKWLVNGMVWESLGFGRRDGFAGIVLNISFFDATEEGDILFLQKNLQVSSGVGFRYVE